MAQAASPLPLPHLPHRWLYLLSDAFDMTDTQQAFIYWDRVSDQGRKKLPSWIKRSSTERTAEAKELAGSTFQDLSLWWANPIIWNPKP